MNQSIRSVPGHLQEALVIAFLPFLLPLLFPLLVAASFAVLHGDLRYAKAKPQV
jgi:hypothetical protein